MLFFPRELRPLWFRPAGKNHVEAQGWVLEMSEIDVGLTRCDMHSAVKEEAEEERNR